MENNIIRLEKLSQYNALKGIETQHPLITVYDNSKQKHFRITIVFILVFMPSF